MDFSEVRLSYSLFTNTNKTTKIAIKNKLTFFVPKNTITDENKTFFEY
jgi:hypothetical protein